MFKLSDLLSSYNRFKKLVKVNDYDQIDYSENFPAGAFHALCYDYNEYYEMHSDSNYPLIGIQLTQSILDRLDRAVAENNLPVKFDCVFAYPEQQGGISASYYSVTSYTFTAKSLADYYEDNGEKYIILSGTQSYVAKKAGVSNIESSEDRSIILKLTDTYTSSGDTKYVFTSVDSGQLGAQTFDFVSPQNYSVYNALIGESQVKNGFDNMFFMGYPGGNTRILFTSMPSSATYLTARIWFDDYKTKFYPRSMFLATGTEEMKKTICYDEYPLNITDTGEVDDNNVPIYTYSCDYLNLVNMNVDDVFSIDVDNKNRNFIKVDLSQLDSQTVKSVQYWYYDDNSKSLHFVFGVNVDSADFTRGYVKVYLSMISTRNEKVYDYNHNCVGKIYNYADEDSDKNFGEYQYYEENNL